MVEGAVEPVVAYADVAVAFVHMAAQPVDGFPGVGAVIHLGVVERTELAGYSPR